MKKSLIMLMMSISLILCLTGCNLENVDKDKILGKYNSLVETAGKHELTSDKKLKGKKTMGEDDYTGSYVADYEDFTGTEYLFGRTSIESGEETITINCELTIKSGEAKVFISTNNDNKEILVDQTGTYEKTVTLSEGRNYIGMDGENFNGSFEIDIE